MHNTIDCMLVPVTIDDAILQKMKKFNIVTPDKYDIASYQKREYYCVPKQSFFTIESLKTLESDYGFSKEEKEILKTQFMKICSFAYIFNVSNKCVRDKYNNLIPVDLSAQEQQSILTIENITNIYSTKLTTEIVNQIYTYIDKLLQFELITYDDRMDIIDKFQEQLTKDGFIQEIPEYGICCCCGDPCNPCSQTCSVCPRNGRLIASYLNTNTVEIENDFQHLTLEDETPEAIKKYKYNDEDCCLLTHLIKLRKEFFKGNLNPKKAVKNKNIPHYVVSKFKKQWISCDDVNEKKAKILIPTKWIETNIPDVHFK
jgi:hypothetical protein